MDTPPDHVVLVASGGLDSTTLAHLLHARGSRLTFMAVDYGQRHRIELAFAKRAALRLDADFEQVDLSGLTPVLAGSALTDPSVEVPDGHYTDERMASTVVPNRNALMLDLAVALAVSRGASAVAFGAHAGDHPVYPDCRPAFVEAFEQSARVANEGFLDPGFHVLAPFLTMTKAQIVSTGAELGVPFEETWSCYRGREAAHCGRCGTCMERREAFSLAGVQDPTTYASTDHIATGR
ncbi:7-cyano-7-deazaguanine synthase QueC [Nocardiopsis tropica]|uniref:7-cyano-7-deazaguanine synthase QueC n=1 Tax=Nocardiopsis tropica TaxID=109330 RepID=UPI002E8C9B6F|nr:7-cyano-7-deazaguanine synthase QueC [Nocardiopsis tropica]